MQNAIVAAGSVAGIFVGGILGKLAYGGNGDAVSLMVVLFGAMLGVLAGGWIAARIVDH